MVKWDNVCLPRDFGGLGIINTMIMNAVLLTKWIWRIQVNDPEDFCIQLLRRKYLNNKVFYNSNVKGGSQFWAGLHEVKDNLWRGL